MQVTFKFYFSYVWKVLVFCCFAPFLIEKGNKNLIKEKGIQIGGTSLKSVNRVKLVGIHIDGQLDVWFDFIKFDYQIRLNLIIMLANFVKRQPKTYTLWLEFVSIWTKKDEGQL